MPAVINEVRLWFIGGNSDKVYNVVTEQNGDGTYTVTARWGRRGKHMSEQTKAYRVDRYTATVVADSLVDSKVAKGYRKV